MRDDFEKNCKADPEEMNKVVKREVEVALLRMTEKKMMVEMQLEKAQNEIKQKDARIAELERVVRQLVAQGTSQINIQDSNNVEMTNLFDASIVTGIAAQGTAGQNGETSIPMATPVLERDTDADLNERDEFTAEEERLRQDGTFGIGDDN